MPPTSPNMSGAESSAVSRSQVEFPSDDKIGAVVAARVQTWNPTLRRWQPATLDAFASTVADALADQLAGSFSDALADKVAGAVADALAGMPDAATIGSAVADAVAAKLAELPPPVVNVDGPHVEVAAPNVTVEPTPVNVAAPTVNVPAPVVNVPAPVVNVAPAGVTVQRLAIPAPVLFTVASHVGSTGAKDTASVDVGEMKRGLVALDLTSLGGAQLLATSGVQVALIWYPWNDARTAVLADLTGGLFIYAPGLYTWDVGPGSPLDRLSSLPAGSTRVGYVPSTLPAKVAVRVTPAGLLGATRTYAYGVRVELRP